MSQAVDFHKKSLRLNPFLWSSFEALCNFGEKVDPQKYFTLNSALNAYNNQMNIFESYDMARLITASNPNAKAGNNSTQPNLCAAELFAAHKENNTSINLENHDNNDI